MRKTIYTPEGYLSADTTIASVTNSTTAVVSSAATATDSGQAAHITTPSMNWGSLRDLQVTTTNFTSQTGAKMYDAHGGDVDIRTLGNSVSANTRILLSVQSLGTVTAPKAIAVTARTAGASFTITSADATDTSVVAWELIEPA